MDIGRQFISLWAVTQNSREPTALILCWT